MQPVIVMDASLPRRRACRARVLSVLAIALLTLGATAGGQARAATARTVVHSELVVPDPGHVTIEVFSQTVERPSAHLRRSGLLRPSVPGTGSLPSSVRILSLRRTFVTRGAVRSVLLFVLINLPQASGARSSGAIAQAPQTSQAFSCTVNAGTPVIVRVEGITELVGDLLLQATSPRCPLIPRGAGYSQSIAVNADLLSVTSRSVAQRDMADALLLIDEPTSRFESDQLVDTGHYDDGHAFGWKLNTPSQLRAAELEIVRYLDHAGNDWSATLLPMLNGLTGVTIGESQAGQGINTQVGQPQVM
jgi:hypothetical protein